MTMTKDSRAAEVVVEQVDREAAASLLGGACPDGLLTGQRDSLSLIQTLARHRIAAAEPAGDWVLVPREPTQDMCDDATEVLIDDGRGRHTALNWEEAAAVYRAMLAAARPSDAHDMGEGG